MVATCFKSVTALQHETSPYTPAKGETVVPVFLATIYQNEDGVGYYAKCPVDDMGCAFTCGDTIGETQANMYESFALLIEDDYPDITDYALEFCYFGKADV